MAGKNYSYKPGDPWSRCQRCGFVYRASQLKREWTGLYVCKYDYDPRHPQELIRIPEEDQRSVDWNLNDEAENFVDVTFEDTNDDIPEGNFTTNNETIT